MVELKFHQNDYVGIIPLGIKGRVEGVYIGAWTRYDVRYFYNGVAQSAYFQADELEQA